VKAAADRDTRVAPHIYRSRHGWRVYVRRDGRLRPVRFKGDATLEQLQQFVDSYKKETARLKKQQRAAAAERAGTFAADAARYLKLKVVKAMESYADRTREITRWVDVFGGRPRGTITESDINEQLQAWYDAGSRSVNKYRAALMSLYTQLDGRAAANVVKNTRVFDESEQIARGVDYALLDRILAEIPEDRSRPVKGEKGSTKRGSLSRVRIEVMLETGMAPVQVGRLLPSNINLRERWYTSPRRKKGKRDKSPRPLVRKPMTKRAHAAFKRFIALKAWGPFDRRSLRHTWIRAQRRAEQAIQKERRNPRYRLPHIRLYDIRHSFGTRLFRATKDLRLVGEMLDHTSERTTRRYALGAVADVLADGMRQFEAATTRRRG
jgi:integrase